MTDRGTSEWLIKLTALSRDLRLHERKRIDDKPRPEHTPDERKQTVVGGSIPRDPVNRQAAMLVAKQTNWLCHPPDLPPQKISEPPITKKKRKKKGKRMSKQEVSNAPIESSSYGPNTQLFGDYEIKGIRGADGELLFRVSDMNRVLMAMCKDLPEKSIPVLERAQDARAAVTELLDGLGHDMTLFQDGCTKFLEDVRQSRMAVVAETSTMTKSLREVRQFFIGNDYDREITRLREFVELCERLVALKKDGTLDALSDTIIKLAC